MSSFVTKKSLSRRTILRGLGATIALPLLDGMTPAFGAAGKTPIRRFGAVYVPNGMNIWSWTPSTEGVNFELSPILAPLAPFRDQMVVVSGLANRSADPVPGEGSGDHVRAQTAFLTGAHAKKTEGLDLLAGVSMDQILAKEFGRETQLASLELALENNETAGGCENGYSCTYSGTLAWSSPTTPLPMETNPRAVFERMFGAADSTDRRVRLARIREDRSVLDAVTAQLADLQRRIGVPDQRKLTEYLDSIRDLERRIQKAEEQSDRELPTIDQPQGVPASFEEYAHLQFDLMALAYQTDLTRVATFLIAREQSTRTYPEIGAPEPHHAISHHQNRPEMLEKLAKLNTFHLSLFAHLLEKLQSMPDGDGTVLDHSVILYGAGMSNPDAHIHHDLPLLLMGGGAGQVKGGRHVRFPDADRTPMANLHRTVLGKLGIPVERFADSTGQIDLLPGV
jgi:hypothetical protein